MCKSIWQGDANDSRTSDAVQMAPPAPTAVREHAVAEEPVVFALRVRRMHIQHSAIWVGALFDPCQKRSHPCTHALFVNWQPVTITDGTLSRAIAPPL